MQTNSPNLNLLLIEALQKMQHFDTLVSLSPSDDINTALTSQFEHIYIRNISANEFENTNQFLQKTLSSIKSKTTLFWFNAELHYTLWTKFLTYPLIKDLQTLSYLESNSVIIINNAQLFLSLPKALQGLCHWPNLDATINTLKMLSTNHTVTIVHDYIIFCPKHLVPSLRQFAYTHNLNWMVDFDNKQISANLLALFKPFDDKDKEIKEVLKKTIIEDMDQDNNEQLLKLRSAHFSFFKALYSLLKFYAKIIKSFIKKNFPYLVPQLGSLYQHPPRPVIMPKNYVSNLASNELPSISIVTPAYNHGAYIERTIKSVLNQAYPKLEYIVQDGGSKDATIDILKNYHTQLTHWESTKDNGQSHAINLGFRHSSGEIMAYLNSDDLLLPGALHYVGEFFAKNPHVDVVYGHRILIDTEDNEIGRWILPSHDSSILSWVDYIPQETLFWRRSSWDKIGAHIDENFRFAMDWDLLLRLRDTGARFARLPRFLGAFRIHPEQKTSKTISLDGINEMRKLRERSLGKIVPTREVKAKTRYYLFKHVLMNQLYHLGFLHY
jgi:glycosyltransferase involved in cell wall biosynthesis